MEAKAGMTKQGVRDLNHAGPRGTKEPLTHPAEDRPKVVTPSVEAETKDPKDVTR